MVVNLETKEGLVNKYEGSEFQQFAQIKEKTLNQIGDSETKITLGNTLDSIYTSKEFSLQELQKALPNVCQRILGESRKTIYIKSPNLIRKFIQEFLENSNSLIEKTNTKKEGEGTNREKNEKQEILLNKLQDSLQSIKLNYPNYAQELITITEESSYYQEHKNIFTNTPFQTREQQEPIIHYRYLIDHIHKNAQRQGYISAKEQEYIQSYNAFCQESGINDFINTEFPVRKINEVHNIQDLINHEQLGKHLYQESTSIKQFVDQKQGEKLGELNNQDIIEHIFTLFPDTLQTDLQNILLKYSEQNILVQELIQNGKINKNLKVKSQIYQEIIQTVEKYSNRAKKEIDTIRQQNIKQHALGVCIQTLAEYFDTTTINLEQFSQDTKLQAKDISIDEKGEWVTIKGIIQGKQLTILYNINTGIIQSQDFIAANTGTIFTGNNTKNRETLRFTGPKYKDIYQQCHNRDTLNKENIRSYGSLQEIDKKYGQKLAKEIQAKPNEIMGKEIMEQTIEKNIASKQIQEIISSGLPNINTRTQSNTPEIFKLYTIFDQSMDRYTPDEIRKLRNILQKFENIIQKIQTTHEKENIDPLRYFLFSATKLQEDKTGKKIEGYSFYKFFHAMTRDEQDPMLENIIDLNKFQNTVTSFEKQERFPQSPKTLDLIENYQNEQNKKIDQELEEAYNEENNIENLLKK